MRRLLHVCLLAAALGVLAIPAFAERDIVQFGSTIHVARDTSIHDAVCFFCSVDADGTVEGDIVVFFGDVHIAGHANHDVVNFFGGVTADSNATVGQNMVSMFGSIRLGENVSIGKDLVAMFGGIHAPSSVSVGGDRVIQPGWVFWGPLLIFALVVVFVVREFRNQRRREYMRRYPFPPHP
ncbi:MAG TPA: hypothetical protein VGG85_05140 [Terracidiphilus sp.]|jgi:hypothetical protein